MGFFATLLGTDTRVNRTLRSKDDFKSYFRNEGSDFAKKQKLYESRSCGVTAVVYYENGQRRRYYNITDFERYKNYMESNYKCYVKKEW